MALADAIHNAGYQNLSQMRREGAGEFYIEEMTENFYHYIKTHGYDGMTDSWSHDPHGLIDFFIDD